MLLFDARVQVESASHYWPVAQRSERGCQQAHLRTMLLPSSPTTYLVPLPPKNLRVFRLLIINSTTIVMIVVAKPTSAGNVNSWGSLSFQEALIAATDCVVLWAICKHCSLLKESGKPVLFEGKLGFTNGQLGLGILKIARLLTKACRTANVAERPAADMPGGRYDALRASIAKEPWDAAAWEGLVALSAASGSLDQQREILEELLSQFPTAVRLTALQASDAPLRYNTASRSVQLLE